MASIPRTVFIVTSGEYSDYRIDSVWDTREAAEAHALNWADVEEWILNDNQRRTITQWQAYTQWDEIRVRDEPFVSDQVDHTTVEKRGDRWCGWGYGPTPEHARKSLADALAKAKAQEAGL